YMGEIARKSNLVETDIKKAYGEDYEVYTKKAVPFKTGRDTSILSSGDTASKENIPFKTGRDTSISNPGDTPSIQRLLQKEYAVNVDVEVERVKQAAQVYSGKELHMMLLLNKTIANGVKLFKQIYKY
ncbi:MAG: hypothetical protein RR459_07015, partial [Christensenellaceae bacterium]